MTIKELSKKSGFSRDTLHRWKARYLQYSLAGLLEKSRVHHGYPKTTSSEITSLIRELRLSEQQPGAEKIARRLKKRHGVAIHWQTVHKIIKKEGLVRKRRRLPKKEQWVKKPSFPGEIVQIDVAFMRRYK